MHRRRRWYGVRPPTVPSTTRHQCWRSRCSSSRTATPQPRSSWIRSWMPAGDGDSSTQATVEVRTALAASVYRRCLGALVLRERFGLPGPVPIVADAVGDAAGPAQRPSTLRRGGSAVRRTRPERCRSRTRAYPGQGPSPARGGAVPHDCPDNAVHRPFGELRTTPNDAPGVVSKTISLRADPPARTSRSPTSELPAHRQTRRPCRYITAYPFRGVDQR